MFAWSALVHLVALSPIEPVLAPQKGEVTHVNCECICADFPDLEQHWRQDRSSSPVQVQPDLLAAALEAKGVSRDKPVVVSCSHMLLVMTTHARDYRAA
jgi:hypothetical protein